MRGLSHAPVRSSRSAPWNAAALAWPGTEQHWCDGWLLRAGGGHTAGPTPLSAALLVEHRGAARHHRLVRRAAIWSRWLALLERLLPIKAAGIKATRVLTREISPVKSPDVTLSPEPDAHWLATYPGARVPTEPVLATPSSTGSSRSLPCPTPWAGLRSPPSPTAPVGSACRRCVSRNHRGAPSSGPRDLLLRCTYWGVEQGATRAYVQVLDDNRPALTLYESAGFRLHHHHRYISAPR